MERNTVLAYTDGETDPVTKAGTLTTKNTATENS